MLRIAEERDMPQVNWLRAQLASMHARAREDLFHCVDDEARIPAMQASGLEMLLLNNADILLFEEDGVIAGFACIEYRKTEASQWVPEQSCCYIKEFGVHESFRRRGIGKALMEFVKECATERGIHRLELDVWAFNGAAIHLYESMGFRPRTYYMELDLE